MNRSELLRFLRDTQSYIHDAADPEIWRAGLNDYAIPQLANNGDLPLRPAQIAAWEGLAESQVGLVLGPPGTGKTHLLAWLILGYIQARLAAGLTARVWVSAFTRNAVSNLLNSVAKRSATYAPGLFGIIFAGDAPQAGLMNGIRHARSVYGPAADELLQALSSDAIVMGGSVWSLYKLLGRPAAGGDGFLANLFDLVCIDEASQMVLGNGLMSLAGLKGSGRVIIAGDDKQLPPIRSASDIQLNGRRMGGSLYSFLKSTAVPEFALDETFRLNGPLAAFPEKKFYPGRYVSAEPDKRLSLIPNWQEGLADWEVQVLSPDNPIAIIVHEGPPAATSNPFETAVVTNIAKKLAERFQGAGTGGVYGEELWQEKLAIVSPHRAQNVAIRQGLQARLKPAAFVETVDRIQGKERDAIILSYCVSDGEFAVAESEFIFSPERLNVAVTRARTKLIVVISRQLIDAIPSDQETMDKAEILREFVFDATAVGHFHIPSPSGQQIPFQVRTVPFEPGSSREDVPIQPPAQATTVDDMLSTALINLLEAIRDCANRSLYGHAADFDIRAKLATSRNLLPELVTLHQQGAIDLQQRGGAKPFWVALPLVPARQVYATDIESVRERLEAVINQSRRRNMPPFYTEVRRRFAWMDIVGNDVLFPTIERLKDEGCVILADAKGNLTVDWRDLDEAVPEPSQVTLAALSDRDFEILNELEDLETRQINFGVFENWISPATFADSAGLHRNEVLSALARLNDHGYVMIADDDRVSSRIAELARELRLVKQRFQVDDSADRPYLVRSLKLEIRNRDKPKRDQSVSQFFSTVADGLRPEYKVGALGVRDLLLDLWGRDAQIAGFQARSFESLLRAWVGDSDTGYVIAADTGAGKTEAAALPFLAGIVGDRLSGIRGVRAVLAYPRVRLVANQAQRLVKYLAALADIPGIPLITLGIQTAQVPTSFDRFDENLYESWTKIGGATFNFPLFGCPSCGAPLLLHHRGGDEGADRLACTACKWTFKGWIGSKATLADTPPAIFMPTTDSLHQWLHDTRYGRLFGDDKEFAPPRAVLADEIHLYSHIHGAQVGATLRRLMARAEASSSSGQRVLAVGMSATLGDPAGAWSKLSGRSEVELLTPSISEKSVNPRAREYFFFVQPEIESRGQDIAGASTTIQSLMCLAHGMRRRKSPDGGYRGLVFMDSIDKMRRLHAAFYDAEMTQRLSSYRTRLYPDDPVTGQPRTSCCGKPYGCDMFHDGECWWFAATDKEQMGARGSLRIGRPLKVAEHPVSAASDGRAEDMIKASDIIFATSSLEVGYDDPDINLVYQHYAPSNLASFIQRKGRGGRGVDDRPITAATLSLYSSRDSWWFRHPRQMIEPDGFEVPLNPDNFFVRRGQVLAATLDAFARSIRAKMNVDPASPSETAFKDAQTFVERIFGPEVWSDMSVSSLSELWGNALQERYPGTELRYLSDVRKAVPWIPDNLFDSINLPKLTVAPADGRLVNEDIGLALATTAPGNATRRYDFEQVHWRPPVAGLNPWFALDDYKVGHFLSTGFDEEELLDHIPNDARTLLGRVESVYFRPKTISLNALGTALMGGWTSKFDLTDDPTPVVVPNVATSPRSIQDDARGTLRGFPILKYNLEHGRHIGNGHRAKWLDKALCFECGTNPAGTSGLELTQVFWAADAEVPMKGPGAEPAALAQIFVRPGSKIPLLHGFAVQTEGVQFHLNRNRLETFVASTAAQLSENPRARRRYLCQWLRYEIESRTIALGANVFEARRIAEILSTAYADDEIRRKLVHVTRFWDRQSLAEILETTRRQYLTYHPLLSFDRVAALGDTFGSTKYKPAFQAAIASLGDEAALANHLATLVVHSLAIRLKQSFVLIAQGDIRQVVIHTRLPSLFDQGFDGIITVCEAGAFGDGTTRSFASKFDQASQQWENGFLDDCPNAQSDRVLHRFLEKTDQHEAWRSLDPSDPTSIRKLAADLGVPPDQALPAVLLRILFGIETVALESFALYDLAMELHRIADHLAVRLSRMPSAWETISYTVEASREDENSVVRRLIAAYARIEHAVIVDSLSPENRVADQLLRVFPITCNDGCQACVHQPSNLMSESLTQASTSREMLHRFICY